MYQSFYSDKVNGTVVDRNSEIVLDIPDIHYEELLIKEA